MLVFMKQRMVMLSVPKTGTTAWQTALAPVADIVVRDPPELKHAPLYRYNRFFRPMFEKVCKAEMETVAVMREPVDWLGSWYRYRQRPFMEGKPNSTHGVSFDDFVEAYCTGQPPSWANVGSQAKFLEPRPNGTAVTHLFRYDQPDKLLDFMQARLDRSITLERENVSPDLPLTLSDDIARKLRRKRPEEFDLYLSIDP